MMIETKTAVMAIMVGEGVKTHREKFWNDENVYTSLMVFTWVCVIVKIHQTEHFKSVHVIISIRFQIEPQTPHH